MKRIINNYKNCNHLTNLIQFFKWLSLILFILIIIIIWIINRGPTILLDRTDPLWKEGKYYLHDFDNKTVLARIIDTEFSRIKVKYLGSYEGIHGIDYLKSYLHSKIYNLNWVNLNLEGDVKIRDIITVKEFKLIDNIL